MMAGREPLEPVREHLASATGVTVDVQDTAMLPVCGKTKSDDVVVIWFGSATDSSTESDRGEYAPFLLMLGALAGDGRLVVYCSETLPVHGCVQEFCSLYGVPFSSVQKESAEHVLRKLEARRAAYLAQQSG